MRLDSIRVLGFRSLREVTLNFDSFTALVGANGAGKSSVLYALDWFFNGGVLTEDDCNSAKLKEGEAAEVAVAVTFADLDAADRELLGKYGRAATAHFRRSIDLKSGEEKLFGNSRRGPGFAGLDGLKVEQLRKAYGDIREALPELPEASTKTDILGHLADWEANPANYARFEDVDPEDARHLFGATGQGKLRQRFQFVLVPAVGGATENVAAAGRTSPLAKLLGDSISTSARTARETWLKEHEASVTDLEDSIKNSVSAATTHHSSEINRHLIALVPTARLEFVPEVPSPFGREAGGLRTTVTLHGETSDVTKHGHGVQRAVVISLIHALATSAATEGAPSTDAAENDAGNRVVADGEVVQAVEVLPPSVLLAIEEPELYQHPVRARHFADVLTTWSDQPGFQVVCATHSAHLVRPDRFGAVRRFFALGGSTTIVEPDLDAVVAASGKPLNSIAKFMVREFPRQFSESFFSDAVVLVEGDTDAVLIETLASRCKPGIGAGGISILAVSGKSSLRIPHEILTGLRIPTYVVADADYEPELVSPTPEQTQSRESRRQSTEALMGWLPGVPDGTQPTFAWGDASKVAARWCLWQQDIERELSAWPAFEDEIKRLGYSLRQKDVWAVRSAAMEVPLDGMPPSFVQLLDAIELLSTVER